MKAMTLGAGFLSLSSGLFLMDVYPSTPGDGRFFSEGQAVVLEFGITDHHGPEALMPVRQL
jgi:hypothetical protein